MADLTTMSILELFSLWETSFGTMDAETMLSIRQEFERRGLQFFKEYGKHVNEYWEKKESKPFSDSK